MAYLKRVMLPEKRAWTIRDFGLETSLSRATIYRLMDAGELQFVMIGRARRIITPPLEFLRGLDKPAA